MARWDSGGWGASSGGAAADPWGSYTPIGGNASWGSNDGWSAGNGGGSGGDRWGASAWSSGAGGGDGGGNNNAWAGADLWGGDSAGTGGATGGATQDQWGSGGGGGGGESKPADDAWGDGAGGGWNWTDNDDPSSWATQINRQIDWNGMQLIKIEKNFYEEHHTVGARTDDEVQEIRRKYDIEVLGGEGSNGIIPNPVTTFEEASLPDWLLSQVHKKGFQAPTPIQIQVWPVALQGRDLIGIAETGSGKTLAYLLPMMVHIVAQDELKANEGPVGVVLCPTRELALQIDTVAKEYIGPSGLKSTCVYGGARVADQGRALREKNDIVVATPGRFIQLLNEAWTNLNRVTYVVLDEADEMLSKGFGQQIELIMTQVRPDRQVLMFSATWPKEVQSLSNKYCTANEGMEPVVIRVGGDKLAACRSITQNVLVFDANTDKFYKLKEAIYRSKCNVRGNPHKCLIFCRTKSNVDDLVNRLNEENIEAWGLHAQKTQNERMWVLDQFKNGELSCVASTNCLGRGHDIPRVKYVINFDAPNNIESYIHRIGRTGRAGENGFAMTFLTEKDWKLAEPLVRVLSETKQPVPEKLQELARLAASYETPQQGTDDFGGGNPNDGGVAQQWDTNDAWGSAAGGQVAATSAAGGQWTHQ